MREFCIDLLVARDLDQFTAAFNAGFVKSVSGHWDGQNMNAFHDYLSWPAEEKYRLRIHGWKTCAALSDFQRKAVLEILSANPHVEVVFE